MPLRIDPVDQTRAVGAGNEVALRVPRQSADVRLVALEEQLRRRAGLSRIDAINRSGISRRNVEASGGIEGQVPDVMRLAAARLKNSSSLSPAGCIRLSRVEDDRRIGFILLGGRVRVELVDFAARHRGGVERAIGSEAQRLNAEVSGFKERERLFARLLAQPQARLPAIPCRQTRFPFCRPRSTTRRSKELLPIRSVPVPGAGVHRSRSKLLRACPSQTPPFAIAAIGACPGPPRARRLRRLRQQKWPRAR